LANPEGEEGEKEEEDKYREEEDARGHVRIKDVHLSGQVVLQLQISI